MQALMDATAEQLASTLEGMADFPHNTGGLSMLDEATLQWGWRYEQIGPLQRAFADARHAHMRSYRTETGNYSDEAWTRAMVAAKLLAGALSQLGEARIERCHRPAKWGTCNRPLEDDGTCRGMDHTDENGDLDARPDS